MCMLCVVPPHVLPDKDKLINSALNNPHGFGFAIVVPEDKYIISERTMNADESISRFLELRARFPKGYALWHARYATHGSNTIENCHPFAVGGDPSTYLGHNGILPVLEWKDLDWSDTRIFAEDILPAMGGVKALDNPQLLNMIEDFSTGSKLCVLTVDPAAKHECYIIHEDKGSRDTSGVWWSNDSCYLATPKSYGYYYNDAWDSDFYNTKTKTKTQVIADNEDWECTSCGALWDYMEMESNQMVCEFCGGCQDCGEFIQSCECTYWKNRADSESWWAQYATYKGSKKIHSVPQSEMLDF